MAFCDAAGHALEPNMVVDNKDKASITETDIKKLIRDAKERKLAVAVIVTRDESQLRQGGQQCRGARGRGVGAAFDPCLASRDLKVLRPVFDRMRVEGPDPFKRLLRATVVVAIALVIVSAVAFAQTDEIQVYDGSIAHLAWSISLCTTTSLLTV
jgi:hypothetical protein